jgi:phospholipid/cholesterol/gamma-HCH transport system substrate-binding protein
LSSTTATIAFSAKLVDGSGHLKAARIFEQSCPMDAMTATKAATAFDAAFEALSRDVVKWTTSAQ